MAAWRSQELEQYRLIKATLTLVGQWTRGAGSRSFLNEAMPPTANSLPAYCLPGTLDSCEQGGATFSGGTGAQTVHLYFTGT